MSSRPRPEDMSREEIEMELLVYLSTRAWYNITGSEGTDPDAAESLAFGTTTPLQPLWIFSRYADGGKQFALVGSKLGPDGARTDFKAVTTEQFKLEWLWKEISASRRLEDANTNREGSPE